MSAGYLLDHHALESIDIDADVEFFTRAVGMTVIRWGSHALSGRRIAMLADPGSAKLELIEVDKITGDYAHTAFLVADVPAVHAAVVSAGLGQQRQAPFRLIPAKAQCSLLASPTGRCLQLIAYDPDSPDLLVAQSAAGGGETLLAKQRP